MHFRFFFGAPPIGKLVQFQNKSEIYILGVKVQNMKMDFKTGMEVLGVGLGNEH